LTDSTVAAIVCDPAHFGVLYVGTEDQGVLRSSDGGETFTTLNTGLPSDSVFALGIDQTGRRIYAVSLGGVYDFELPRSLFSPVIAIAPREPPSPVDRRR
jgi:hypothetical protein